MKLDGHHLLLAATDIARHLDCRYLTQLDRAAAEGRLTPQVWEDPVLDALRERRRQATVTRDELEHANRAACDIAKDDTTYVFGSQAILGQFPVRR